MNDPFDLLPDEIEYLDANYPQRWQKLSEGEGKYAVQIDEFVVPCNLSPNRSTLLILIPSGYPLTPLDMFYFAPPISRNDDYAIPALIIEQHFGIEWQRWSRHYDWQPGDDNLISHIEHVKEELDSTALK